MNLNKWFPERGIARNILTIMTGTATAQLLVVVFMPVVTRLYSPESIGAISIYLAFFNLWFAIQSLRFNGALLITANDGESYQVYRLGLFSVIFLSVISMPILFILNIYDLLGFGILPSWAPFVCFISLLGFGWFSLYRAWLLRLGETKSISFATVSRSAANVGTRLICGFSIGGVFGLLLAEIAGSWSALLAVRKKIKKVIINSPPPLVFRDLKLMARKYRKFPLYETPSTFLNQLAGALQIPFIAMLYGAEAAGWFGLARLLFAIPNGQLGGAVADVFQFELGKCLRDGNVSRGRELFYKLAKRLSLIGLVPLTIAILLAPLLTEFIFGEQWAEMGKIVAQIAPWMYAALIVSSLSRALSVLQRQELKLIYDILSLFLTLAVFSGSSIFSLTLSMTVTLLTVGMCLSYVVYFLLIRFSFNKSINKI